MELESETGRREEGAESTPVLQLSSSYFLQLPDSHHGNVPRLHLALETLSGQGLGLVGASGLDVSLEVALLLGLEVDDVRHLESGVRMRG